MEADIYYEQKDMSFEIKTKPIISQESLDRFIEFEGKIPHFYLDGPGHVTIGIGCVISDAGAASKLNLYRKLDNLAAKDIESIDEFKMVKYLLPGKQMSYYNELTKLYLPDNDILNLFYFRFSDTKSLLAKQIPEFNDLPDKIQEVLIDMTFNLGISGLLIKFPKFVDAIRNKKFDLAARESHRNGIQEARNNWTKNTILEFV